MPKKKTVATRPLKVVSRPAKGLRDPRTRRLYLFKDFATDSIIIGRGVGCDIQIRNERVSTGHALVKIRHDGCAEISNLGRNGTYIDGECITDGVVLLEGMQIHLGSEAMLVATNEQGGFPIVAYTVHEFCYYARELYGSIREASKFIGKSRKFMSGHIAGCLRRRTRRWYLLHRVLARQDKAIRGSVA